MRTGRVIRLPRFWGRYWILYYAGAGATLCFHFHLAGDILMPDALQSYYVPGQPGLGANKDFS